MSGPIRNECDVGELLSPIKLSKGTRWEGTPECSREPEAVRGCYNNLAITAPCFEHMLQDKAEGR